MGGLAEKRFQPSDSRLSGRRLGLQIGLRKFVGKWRNFSYSAHFTTYLVSGAVMAWISRIPCLDGELLYCAKVFSRCT